MEIRGLCVVVLSGLVFMSGCATVTWPGVHTYYVDAAMGRDSSNGLTLATAFLTIQKAASVAVAGDTVYVRTGTYRETVTPAHSGTAGAPITFARYLNEQPVVSGANLLSGWSLDAGSVYKATMSTDLGRGYNQVFVDGQMLMEAQQPYTSFANLLNPNGYTATGISVAGTTVTVTSSSLTQAAGYWVGATIVFDGRWGANRAGSVQTFSAETAVVTSSAVGSLVATFDHPYDRVPVAPIPFYLFGGVRAMLDTAGEWVRASGNLYLWTLTSDNPTRHTVEVKARSVGFNLNGKSYLTISGINLFAANVTTDAHSTHNIIDQATITYVSHAMLVDEVGTPGGGTGDPGNSHADDTGIVLTGASNTLQNSRITFSSGNGVTLWGGSNQVVFNNLIHDVAYSGQGAAVGFGLQPSDGGVINAGAQVTYNIIYRCTRMCIELTPAVGGAILHNDVSFAMQRSRDGGAIYAALTTDAQQLQVGYNLVHDLPDRSGDACSYPIAGIYLDESEGNIIVHHNILWNIDCGLVGGILPGVTPAGPIRYYNNTVVSIRVDGSEILLPSGYATTLYEFRNNIFDRPMVWGDQTGTATSNNLLPGTNPQFISAAAHDYTILTTSPARDRGAVLPPWTNGFVGTAPDIGAREFGDPFPWTAGANLPSHGYPLTRTSGGTWVGSNRGTPSCVASGKMLLSQEFTKFLGLQHLHNMRRE
jgi:Right handed beta helix region